MGRNKKAVCKFEELNLQQECMRIAQKNIPNIELWLKTLGQIDPAKAIKAWVEITEFAQAKKSKDATSAAPSVIQIEFIPAKRIGKTQNEYIDITPPEPGEDSQKPEMNPTSRPPEPA